MPNALWVLLLLPLPALAGQTVKGRVFYPADAPRPLFLFEARTEAQGDLVRNVSTYTDPAGKELIVEEADLTGGRLSRYSYKQKQVNDFGDASFANERISMRFTEEGKEQQDSEKFDPATLVAPMIQPLLARRWDELMKGDSIKVRYLAIERLETIGFKFFKDRERDYKGRAAVDILMKPSSFFIAALVSPVRLTLLKAPPHSLLESDGRTPIRMPRHEPPRKRGDWHAIDARVEYDDPR